MHLKYLCQTHEAIRSISGASPTNSLFHESGGGNSLLKLGDCDRQCIQSSLCGRMGALFKRVLPGSRAVIFSLFSTRSTPSVVLPLTRHAKSPNVPPQTSLVWELEIAKVPATTKVELLLWIWLAGTFIVSKSWGALQVFCGAPGSLFTGPL